MNWHALTAYAWRVLSLPDWLAALRAAAFAKRAQPDLPFKASRVAWSQGARELASPLWALWQGHSKTTGILCSVARQQRSCSAALMAGYSL